MIDSLLMLVVFIKAHDDSATLAANPTVPFNIRL